MGKDVIREERRPREAAAKGGVIARMKNRR